MMILCYTTRSEVVSSQCIESGGAYYWFVLLLLMPGWNSSRLGSLSIVKSLPSPFITNKVTCGVVLRDYNYPIPLKPFVQ